MGTYTLHMDELQAAIDADDGTTGKMLVRCASNYKDTTGSLYAEFYNDGTTTSTTIHQRRRTYKILHGDRYMDVGRYTAPITPETVPEDGSSRHVGWATDEEQATAETAEKADIVTIPGESFYEVDARTVIR